MPAVAGGFQVVAGGFTGLCGEIDLYAVKLSGELHAEESGVAGPLGIAFLLGSDAGRFRNELNVVPIIFQASEIVEIDIEVINHKVVLNKHVHMKL